MIIFITTLWQTFVLVLSKTHLILILIFLSEYKTKSNDVLRLKQRYLDLKMFGNLYWKTRPKYWVRNTFCILRLLWSYFYSRKWTFSHLLAVVRWMEEVIEAGLVCQAQHFSKDIFGVMLEKGVEENMTQSTVFLSLVLAEVHEPLDVKVGSDELNILEAEIIANDLWKETAMTHHNTSLKMYLFISNDYQTNNSPLDLSHKCLKSSSILRRRDNVQTSHALLCRRSERIEWVEWQTWSFRACRNRSRSSPMDSHWLRLSVKLWTAGISDDTATRTSNVLMDKQISKTELMNAFVINVIVQFLF